MRPRRSKRIARCSTARAGSTSGTRNSRATSGVAARLNTAIKMRGVTGSMANIVKVNTYLTDIRHRADYGPIREEFFGKNKKMPASTLVAV